MPPSIRMRLLRRIARRACHSRLIRGLAKPRTNQRGDVLDPEAAAMLLLENRGGPPLDADLPLEERRRAFDRSCFVAGGDPVPCAIENSRISGMRVRWYGPDSATGGLVFLHGGGWALGGLDSHDGVCRKLAVGSGRLVVSVDYPRSPEARFPEPVHALVEAWPALLESMVSRGIDRSAVALGGDSAGGNLTAAACRLLREGDGPALQFLLYPGLDATRAQASHEEFAEGLVLSRDAIDYYLDQYNPTALDPLASPVLADDLEGLPPALIVVAGFDPLRDEGLLYASRLRDAGVEVELMDFTGQLHGFANMDGLIQSADSAVWQMACSLRSTP